MFQTSQVAVGKSEQLRLDTSKSMAQFLVIVFVFFHLQQTNKQSHGREGSQDTLQDRTKEGGYIE